jgi:cell division protein FtsB
MRLARVVFIVVLVAAAAFALEGGEYGTSDLWKQRGRRQALLRAVDSLERDVDSLQRVRRALERDPALQERIAREEFGMVRGGKEILYRFAEPADTARGRGKKP